MDVALDDEARHFAEEGRCVWEGSSKGDEGRKGLGEFRGVIRAVSYIPGFVVDNGEEVEGVEAEVHGAARRIEQADLTRVFERGDAGCGPVARATLPARGFFGRWPHYRRRCPARNRRV